MRWRPWLQVAVGALAGSPLAQLLLQCSTCVVHFVPACHTPILVCFLDFQPSSPSYNYFEIFAPASPGRRVGSRCCGTPWRGMNSHISCSALPPPLHHSRPNLGQNLRLILGQISIKASREIGKILGHASSLSWKGYETNQRQNSSMHCFRRISRARANTALTNYGKN